MAEELDELAGVSTLAAAARPLEEHLKSCKGPGNVSERLQGTETRVIISNRPLVCRAITRTLHQCICGQPCPRGGICAVVRPAEVREHPLVRSASLHFRAMVHSSLTLGLDRLAERANLH